MTMPVFLVPYSIEGNLPVVAGTAEEAMRIAKTEAHSVYNFFSYHDLSFDTPRSVSCIEEAIHIDAGLDSFDADSGIPTGSGTVRLGNVLPSNPDWQLPEPYRRLAKLSAQSSPAAVDVQPSS
jgi:hypothetical protein